MDDDNLFFKNLFVPLTNKKVFCFLAIIGFFVYFNALFNFFVWDEFPYILYNTELHKFNVIKFFGKNLFNSELSGFYRPVGVTYLSFLYNVFGWHSFFYHLIQVVLHILAAGLLYYLFQKYINKIASFYLSVFFLIHPIQVESVAYIGGLASGLVYLFGVIPMLLSYKKVHTWLTSLVIVLFLLLGLLTKESGFMFPPLIFFLCYFIQKRKLLISLYYSIVPFAIYFLLRFFVAGVYFLSTKDTNVYIQHLPLLGRMANMPAIFFYYIKTLIFPDKLSLGQLWVIKSIDIPNFYLPLLIDILFVILIVVIGYYTFKLKRKLFVIYIFFLFWYLGGMVVMMQIFPVDMTVADRWYYLPFAGLLGILGIGASLVKVKNKNTMTLIHTFLIIGIILLSVRTIVRNSNWHDNLTLFGHDSKVLTNFDIENSLGAELASRKLYKEALPHLVKSVELYSHDTSLYNLGFVYEQLGDYKNAKKYYQETINTRKENSNREEIMQNAFNGMSRVLLLHDTPENASSFLKEAVKIYPSDSTYWSYLALSLYKLNEYNASLDAATKAVKLKPDAATKNMYQKILNREEIKLRY